MNAISNLFAGSIRRLLNGSNAQLERRVANLPVDHDRRQGPRCDNCGFGTLRIISPGMSHAGMLRCDRPGCGHITDHEAIKGVGAP